MPRISKRLIDSLEPTSREFFVWDTDLVGFGVRVHPSGAVSYVAKYRVGRGRTAPNRRVTIGPTTRLSVELAREEAKRLISLATLGKDPASAHSRAGMTVAGLADLFLEEHITAKRKRTTADWAADIINRLIKPSLGRHMADKLSRTDVAQLHARLRNTPFQANRVVALLSSMYGFAERRNLIPEGFNPARSVEKYREEGRERFLTTDELQRLGSALHEAETVGIEWKPSNPDKPNAKHTPKRPDVRRTRLSPHSAAAIRLLLLTGARLGEILNLRWEEVDFERGIAFLADSKTGRKPIVFSAAAVAVLQQLPRMGPFVIAGGHAGKPRHDLKRPWALVCRRAGLSGVRIHDLRHTFASFGAGSGYGLPVIGKLLGHSQATTTQRYAHLDAAPLRLASEAISGQIAEALGNLGVYHDASTASGEQASRLENGPEESGR